MALTRQSDGSYRLARSRIPITETDILVAAEQIFSHRLQRQGTIATPSDAMNYFRCRIGHLPHEEFHTLWLDSRHRILGCDRLFSGTLDGTAVHPRELVRRALEINAGAVVLAHNHPSGVCEPSASDRLLTNELTDALKLIGVRVLDHLVVGAGRGVSLAERGAL